MSAESSCDGRCSSGGEHPAGGSPNGVCCGSYLPTTYVVGHVPPRSYSPCFTHFYLNILFLQWVALVCFHRLVALPSPFFLYIFFLCLGHLPLFSSSVPLWVLFRYLACTKCYVCVKWPLLKGPRGCSAWTCLVATLQCSASGRRPAAARKGAARCALRRSTLPVDAPAANLFFIGK